MSKQTINDSSHIASLPASCARNIVERAPGKYGFLADRKETGSRKMRYVEGNQEAKGCKLCK